MFAQTLDGEPRKRYKNLPYDSIWSYWDFEDSFKDKWVYKKKPKQYLSQYHSMNRKESDSIQEFSDRFTLWLSERRSTSLAYMMKDAIEV